MKLKAVPIELKKANEFVVNNHRHHSPVHRDKFRIACELDGKIVGVIQVGRPLSRYLDDGRTLEVLRLCTDGTKNVCSFLYSRSSRIAKEMGYKKIITYILDNEIGTSLKCSGWVLSDADCGGGNWNVPSRERISEEITLFGEVKKYPTCKKQRWEKELMNDE